MQLTTSSYKVFTQTVTGAQAKQLKISRGVCRDLLKTSPDDAQCMQALALIECQLGELSAAETWLKKASEIDPRAVDVKFHYGLILLDREKYEVATAAFMQVIALVPGHIEAHYRLGCALARNGQLEEAAIVYKHTLKLKPDHVDTLNNLGNLLNNQGMPEEALRCYRAAITTKPDYVMVYNNAGLTFIALGDMKNAEIFYRHALRLRPNYPEALNNLGVSFMLRDMFDEAISWYQKALRLRPNYPEALNNLGNALKDCGHMEEAIESYRKCISHKDTPEFRHNLALVLLATGRFEEGWREYETRWKTKQLGRARREFAQPQWQGEEANGRTILIHAEQGFGDTLQFSRYAKLVKARGFRVVMEVPRALIKLLGSLDGVDHLVVDDRPLPDFDLHCAMLSLPYIMGTTMHSIPASISYLAASQQAVDMWALRLGKTKDKMRVGLIWAGSARKGSQDLIATDRRRSMCPEMLKPLMSIPGIEFFSLQKVGQKAPASFELIDYMEECNDFADTAALVANLDLIISVDTAMAHLAGALGKPVWILNRFNSCWRWFREGETSPWYPSVRLFRQPRLGDWTSVIGDVCAELIKMRASEL